MTAKYTNVKEVVEVIEYVQCNVCNKKIYLNEYSEEYATIKEKWGYYSKNKDGEVHEIHFCDDCYEDMIVKMGIDRQKIVVRNYITGEGEFEER